MHINFWIMMFITFDHKWRSVVCIAVCYFLRLSVCYFIFGGSIFHYSPSRMCTVHAWYSVVTLFDIGNKIFINTLRPRQNIRRFADDTFKCMFLNENVRISIKISLKFVSKGPINNNPALVQIMAWRRSGDKPLSEPMMVSLLTHICVTRPQKLTSCISHVNRA